MRVKILSAAIEDLFRARQFYERQGEGLGEYFFDSVFSDIDSLTRRHFPVWRPIANPGGGV